MIDIDSKIPNIALHKIKIFYQNQGDEVIWNMPILADTVDKIYISCIFEKNRWKAREWEGRAEIGGSGYDVKVKLPKEIDEMRPKINIGFTSRGCNRGCKFCIVPQKEGGFKAVGDIYDFWDGKSKKILLFDNNILLDKKHFKMICSQIRKENLKVDINQGLDIRLLDKEICQELQTIRIDPIRFSFDDIKLENIFVAKMKLLSQYVNMSKVMIYVLVGYDTTIEQDLYRKKIVNDLGADVFFQNYNDKKDKLLREMCRWNNRFYFRNLTFEDYLKKRERYYLWKALKNN